MYGCGWGLHQCRLCGVVLHYRHAGKRTAITIETGEGEEAPPPTKKKRKHEDSGMLEGAEAVNGCSEAVAEGSETKTKRKKKKKQKDEDVGAQEVKDQR